MPMRFGSTLIALALAFGGVTGSTVDVWAAEVEPTRLAVVIPLTVPPETTGLIPAETLETYTAPTGLLTVGLNAVIDRPVAIGLDPMIVASIRILGTAAPESATQWLSRLDNATNEIFALSYADSDVSALSHAGSTSIAEPISFVIDPALFPEQAEAPMGGLAPDETAPPSPTATPPDFTVPTSETLTDWGYTMDSVVWPRRETVTAMDLATFNSVSAVTTILSSANVAAARGASASVDGHAVLVSDDTVSSVLAEAIGSLTESDWQAAMAKLVPAIARGASSGTVLAALDRNLPGNADNLAKTIAALTPLADVTLTSLGDARLETAAAARLVEAPLETERVSRLRLLLAAEALIGPFATLLEDPTLLTGERRLSLLALASNSWLDNQVGWSTAVDEWLERSNVIYNSVQIAESSTLQFFQDKGYLPIAVSNNLDFPVTVYVTVRSDTGILVVLESRVPLVIEPNSQSRASIPVQSIANGQVTLEVSLSSESRVPISNPKQVTTNVIAGWETAATFIIAALLLVIFFAGIVRTVLKRKKLNAANEPAEDAAAVEHGE